MPEEQKPLSGEQKDIQENKLIASLSYLWILFLVPLVLRKESKFCQFHAKQGLILFILSLFSWVPLVGWLIFIAVIVIALIGIYKAYLGEYWEIPYLGKWVKKIKI